MAEQNLIAIVNDKINQYNKNRNALYFEKLNLFDGNLIKLKIIQNKPK